MNEKAEGQLRLQIMGVLQVFNCYGLGDFIPEATAEIVKLAQQYHERMNGNDVPIRSNYSRGRRG